jgi:hypothetical protein
MELYEGQEQEERAGGCEEVYVNNHRSSAG